MRTLSVLKAAANNAGMVVTPDGMHLIVSNTELCRLDVFLLPAGMPVRTIGGKGLLSDGMFSTPRKLCMSFAGTILVAEDKNRRVQEVTLEGKHIRYIGEGAIDDQICAIAACGDLIAVGKCCNTSNNRVQLFSYSTRALVGQFGYYGVREGELNMIHGLRFSPDRSLLFVAESSPNNRVSLFRVEDSKFLRCYGVGVLREPTDVDLAPNGDVIVVDQGASRVAVYSPDGATCRTTGSKGSNSGQFKEPTAVAVVAPRMFVLDKNSVRVQVYE